MRKDVRRLQDALAARGLYAGPRDGRFGPGLRVAIESFERAARMPVSGLATHTLLAVLDGESQIVTGKIESRSVPTSGGPR